jgi:hypothetical protein
VCVALTTGACAPPPDRDTPPPTLTGNGLLKNRLADAPSAYLRRAATQPIPWQAWGDDALMRARALNRPVFLSVGYGACHWCEVMAETTLTDPQVIAALRDDYVPVKVDRDLDPALDEAWLTFVEERGMPRDFATRVRNAVDSLNDTIRSAKTLGPDYCLGHSFFTPHDRLEDGSAQAWMDGVVEAEVSPLIYEYWFDDHPGATRTLALLRDALR